jgi:hypothetical protein
MKRAIAPNLTEVITHQVACGPGAQERVERARRELRAVKAAVRAAERLTLTNASGSWGPGIPADWTRLSRALSRLTPAPARKRRTP